MRKIILAFFICFTTAAFAQKTNFSGTWQVDTNRTVYGQAPKWIIPQTITVDQQSAQLILKRVALNADMEQQPAVLETLPFDGTPFQQTIDDTQFTTAIHWPDDTKFTLKRDGGLVATETWTLADDGRTLVIDRSVVTKSTDFQYTITCFYNKK